LTEQKYNSSVGSRRDASRHVIAPPPCVRGYSIVEMLIVVAMISVLTAMAIPQIVAERRLSRSVNVTREIMSQMRTARQYAMSQRQAWTFQYDNVTKEISLIDHNSNIGRDLINDPAYPNNAGSVVITRTPLATGGVTAAEITYGIPTGLPIGALGDGIWMTGLVGNRLNITFQPDGSVIDGAGNPIGKAMFIYNSAAPRGTASAISVMGASGRTKIWRYNLNANLYVD
jgi:prepilin-type N-terminal cleavage/methylation domain-containing protein